MSTTADPERFVALAGPCNFRDLGGYLTTDGRTTRWGRLYRSDSLHHLTESDLEVLGDVGVRTVVDLRTAAEVERSPVPPVDIWRYRHLSLLPDRVAQEAAAETVGASTPGIDGDHSARYVWFLDAGRGTLTTAIDLMADAESQPLVFHCTAGKDRTGVLAALVLDLLGVERPTIVADYLQSSEPLELILERLRNDPYHGERMSRIPDSWYQVHAATMERFLVGLDEQYGGAAGWAHAAGVPEETIERLRGLLLE